MMPAKEHIVGAPARNKVLDGVRKLAEMVVPTMGPKGRNVLIERGDRMPTVTKDGITVAQEVYLEDPFENMGAQIVKDAAKKTNDAAGDGTTTATLLTRSIMEEGMDYLKAGNRNAISMKRGIDAAVHAVTVHLDEKRTEIEDEKQFKAIATISAQDPAVGDVIASVLKKAGKDGVVTVESGSGFGLEEQFTEGMQFDNGYGSHYFVTDPKKMECVLESVPILLTDERIVSIQQILPLLDTLGKQGSKRIVIIAESVEGDALTTLVINKLKNNFFGVPVKAPGYGQRRLDYLGDLAALTGATVISKSVGKTLEKATIEDLGMARRVVISKNQTTVVEGAGKKEEMEKRVNLVKEQLSAAEKPREKEVLQTRLAKLAGGIAIIRVGAASEFEQKELQHRVEDALSATRAAVEEGVLPGGGVAYVRAAAAVGDAVLEACADEDEKEGARIVLRALPSCFETIIKNAGEDPIPVLVKVRASKDYAFGYDAATGTYGDMMAMQIIDPKKVTRIALQQAASVAGMFLTVEVAMADKRVPVPAQES